MRPEYTFVRSWLCSVCVADLRKLTSFCIIAVVVLMFAARLPRRGRTSTNATNLIQLLLLGRRFDQTRTHRTHIYSDNEMMAYPSDNASFAFFPFSLQSVLCVRLWLNRFSMNPIVHVYVGRVRVRFIGAASDSELRDRAKRMRKRIVKCILYGVWYFGTIHGFGGLGVPRNGTSPLPRIYVYIYGICCVWLIRNATATYLTFNCYAETRDSTKMKTTAAAARRVSSVTPCSVVLGCPGWSSLLLLLFFFFSFFCLRGKRTKWNTHEYGARKVNGIVYVCHVVWWTKVVRVFIASSLLSVSRKWNSILYCCK